MISAAFAACSVDALDSHRPPAHQPPEPIRQTTPLRPAGHHYLATPHHSRPVTPTIAADDHQHFTVTSNEFHRLAGTSPTLSRAIHDPTEAVCNHRIFSFVVFSYCGTGWPLLFAPPTELKVGDGREPPFSPLSPALEAFREATFLVSIIARSTKCPRLVAALAYAPHPSHNSVVRHRLGEAQCARPESQFLGFLRERGLNGLPEASSRDSIAPSALAPDQPRPCRGHRDSSFRLVMGDLPCPAFAVSSVGARARLLHTTSSNKGSYSTLLGRLPYAGIL
ncbi:hypothetical protein D9611_000665 [Ephemerocybe angulata]|uniref:Uncharacterized protein n=1 Tax=Ephemerocybe angulata TaxID=980116 RepID=A0A8H5BMV1_9AGAR|nr:hypothetical protein D9611_000665 [Tulosesus angulatus]